MFKNIVVGLDFSKYSQIVLRQAQVLAKKFQAPLHAVYVSEDPVYMGPPVIYASAFRYVPPTESEMKDELKSFYNLDDAVILHTGSGDVVQKFNSVTGSLDNPLIVVGAAGHSGLERFFIGSHAEKIALRTKCPVWVHRGRRIRHFQYVLLPVDFSESTQKVIDYFGNISGKSSFRLNYLYIRLESMPILDFQSYLQWQKMYKKEMNLLIAEFKKKNKQLKLKVVPGNPVEEIVSRAKNYDLVAMTPHNKTGLFNRFGRTTAKVVSLSPVPVLIIKPGAV